jgi:hypothetical protein
VFLAVNWSVYVYAVATNQVVEASLGYFINPLVSVGLLECWCSASACASGQWLAVGMAIARGGRPDGELRAPAVDQPDPRLAGTFGGVRPGEEAGGHRRGRVA